MDIEEKKLLINAIRYNLKEFDDIQENKKKLTDKDIFYKVKKAIKNILEIEQKIENCKDKGDNKTIIDLKISLLRIYQMDLKSAISELEYEYKDSFENLLMKTDENEIISSYSNVLKFEKREK